MSESYNESSSSDEEAEDEVPAIPPLNLAVSEILKIDQSHDVKIGNTININYNVVMKNQNSNQLVQAGTSGLAGTDLQRTLGELIQDAVAKALPLYLQNHGELNTAIEFQHNGKNIQQLSLKDSRPELSHPVITEPDESLVNVGRTSETSHCNITNCDLQVVEMNKNDNRSHNLMEISSYGVQSGNTQQPVEVETKSIHETCLPSVSNEFIDRKSVGSTLSDSSTINTTSHKSSIGKKKIYFFDPFLVPSGVLFGQNTLNYRNDSNSLKKNSPPILTKTQVTNKNQDRKNISIYKPLRYTDFVEEKSTTDTSCDFPNCSSPVKKDSDKLKNKRITNEDLQLLSDVILQEIINYRNIKEIISFKIPFEELNGFRTYLDFRKRHIDTDFADGNFTGSNNIQIVSIKDYKITEDNRLEFDIKLKMANSKVKFKNFSLKNNPSFFYHQDNYEIFSMQIPEILFNLSVNFSQYENEIHGQIDVECLEINYSIEDIDIECDDFLNMYLLSDFRCYLKKNITRELQTVATSILRKKTLVCDIITNLLKKLNK